MLSSVKSWALWGALCGALYALVIYAPASWLARGLAQLSHHAVLLESAQGTIWQGSAVLTLSAGSGSTGAVSLPSRLHWSITPAWIGFDVGLKTSCCSSSRLEASALVVKFRAQTWQTIGLTLSTSHFALPAQLLIGLGAPWNTMQLEGDLQFATKDFKGRWSFTQGLEGLSGLATLHANNMATALSTIRPLGSYVVTLMDTSLRLQTQGVGETDKIGTNTALVLSGEGQIQTSTGQIHFEGEALAVQGREEALLNLLHIIGQWQPTADGRARSIWKI